MTIDIIKKQLGLFVDPNLVPVAMLEHGTMVREKLISKLEQSPEGMSFKDFMAFALYEPGVGYYSCGKEKIGQGGDFITAPELGPFFAQALAQPVTTYLQEHGGDILEFGAGKGTLAGDLLRTLEAKNLRPRNYFILELSADLRAVQQEKLSQDYPDIVDSVQWLEELPQGFSGIVLANEVLDAMPVHQYSLDEQGSSERGLELNERGEIVWCSLPVSNPLKDYLNNTAGLPDFSSLPSPYYTEINAYSAIWLRSLSAMMTQGLVFLIDYGYSSKEYYHPQRSKGTLRCYFRHYAHDDPLTLVGLQDVTAHVNFSEVAELAHAAGFAIKGYDSQASFLMQAGLLDLMSSTTANNAQAQVLQNQALKRLMSPGGMGEMFKVMVLGKAVEDDVLGCRVHDLRSQL